MNRQLLIGGGLVFILVGIILTTRNTPKIASQFEEVALPTPTQYASAGGNHTPSETPTPSPVYTPIPTLPQALHGVTTTVSPDGETVDVKVSDEQGRLHVSVQNGEVRIEGDHGEWKQKRKEWRKKVSELRSRLSISVHSD